MNNFIKLTLSNKNSIILNTEDITMILEDSGDSTLEHRNRALTRVKETTQEIYALLDKLQIVPRDLEATKNNPSTLTPFEHQICKRLLRKGYNYIARDSESNTKALCAYENEPQKVGLDWTSECGNLSGVGDGASLGDEDFAFVKWEDKKPWLIEDLVKLEIRND